MHRCWCWCRLVDAAQWVVWGTVDFTLWMLERIVRLLRERVAAWNQQT